MYTLEMEGMGMMRVIFFLLATVDIVFETEYVRFCSMRMRYKSPRCAFRFVIRRKQRIRTAFRP